MAESIHNFTSRIKVWNKSFYGHIGSHKSYLMQKLANVQKDMDRFGSNALS